MSIAERMLKRLERLEHFAKGGQVPSNGNKGLWLGPNGERGANQIGFNSALNTADGLSTLWPRGGLLPRPASPLTITLISDAADNGKIVTVQYLTTDYALRQVDKTLSSVTPPTIDDVFRLIRADSETSMTAEVTFENGGIVYWDIAAGAAQSQISAFTSPERFMCAATYLQFATNKNSNLSFFLSTRAPGATGWQDQITASNLTDGGYEVRITGDGTPYFGIKIQTGEDIEIRVQAGANNQSPSGILHMVCVPY